MQNGLTFLLKLSFICLRISNYFYINGFALGLLRNRGLGRTGNGLLKAVFFLFVFASRRECENSLQTWMSRPLLQFKTVQ